jgi:hypothetical protein
MQGEKMNDLHRLIFEDLILCFFGRDEDLEDTYWRPYWIYGDSIFRGYSDSFPENEYFNRALKANYIKGDINE